MSASRITVEGGGETAAAGWHRLGSLTLLLWLTAATRLLRLTWRSLDADEGASLFYSDLPFDQLFRHMADLTLDRHPLFYYVYLRLWRLLTGDTDLELRLLSVFAGLLTVALVYQIGRRRLGHNRAFLAATLYALNPLILYQHQDVRMYTPVMLLSAWAFFVFYAASLGLDRAARPHPLLAAPLLYGTAAVGLIAATYMHVLAVTALPILGLIGLAQLRWQPRRGVWGLAALAVTGLGILPYFWNVFQTNTQGSGSLALSGWYRTALGGAKTMLDNQSVLRFTGNEGLFLLLIVLFLLLAVYRSPAESLPFLGWLATGFLLLGIVVLRVEFFTAKLFAYLAIPLAYLVAIALLGQSGRWRPPNMLPAIALLAFFLAGHIQMVRPDNQREDFRSAATFVDQFATADDAVWVHLNWYQFIFDHYYPRDFAAPLPNNVRSEDEVAAAAAPYLAAEVLWLVQAGVDAAATGLPSYSGDQGRLVERWLAARYPQGTAVFPAGVTVQAYIIRYRFKSLPATAQPAPLAYEEGIQLHGYRLAQTTFPRQDELLHPPSSWVPVTLYWSVDAPLPAGFRPSLSLEDESGNVWGGAIVRDNGLTAFHPPAAWTPGEIVRWDFDVNANPTLPAGQYKLVVRVQRGTDMAFLNHEGGAPWHILALVTFE